MKMLDEFYTRNKKIFDKLGIVRETNESGSGFKKKLDLLISEEIEDFIENMSKPGFIWSELDGSRDQIDESYAGLLKKQAYQQEFARKTTWVFSNPIVKLIIGLWGVLNLITIILYLL